MNVKKLPVRDICYIGIFTARIAICAQLMIPMPYGVPMTLQTFAIQFAGIVIGAKRGALSALVYMLLGAAGAPVFAGFRGGLDVVLGPTGGFVLSFPLMAIAAGIAASGHGKIWLSSWLAAGTIINFLCGMAMYMLILSAGWGVA